MTTVKVPKGSPIPKPALPQSDTQPPAPAPPAAAAGQSGELVSSTRCTLTFDL